MYNNDKCTYDLLTIQIETENSLIIGDIQIPLENDTDISLNEDILFQILNSDMRFLKLENCMISDRRHFDYRPESTSKMMINIDSILSCSIYKKI